MRERERRIHNTCLFYTVPAVMDAPAAIYILRAISTSDMFSTSSVKACTSSNDIPSYILCTHTHTHTHTQHTLIKTKRRGENSGVNILTRMAGYKHVL